MKNAIKFSALLMVTLVLMMSAGCKKDSASTKEFMKLTINGQAKDVPVYSVELLSTVSIVGTISGNYNQIWVNVPEDLSVGVYTLSSEQVNDYSIFYMAGLKNDGVTPDTYYQESGSLDITEYDVDSGKVTGTFNVNCKNTENQVVRITSGSFLVFI